MCFNRNLLCFVSLYLPRSCLVLVAYNKTNIPCLFLFNIEIIHPNNLNNLIVPVGGRWICYSWPFFEKKEVVTEIYFALLEFAQDFVWCWGYIMKKYSMSIFVQYWNYSPLENNIQLRFVSLHINYLGWIIFDIKQKGME